MTTIFHRDQRKINIPAPIELVPEKFIVVRLWKPKLNGRVTNYSKAMIGEVKGKDAAVGHISVEIFNGDDESIYLSHWPDFEARAKRPTVAHTFRQNKSTVFYTGCW